MYGLNPMALAAFAGLSFLSRALCRCAPERRRKALNALCAALLAGNLLRYAVIFPLTEGRIRVPVEFSSIAYFAVPAILLFSRKRLRSWAAYSGLMAGFFYYMALIAAGGPLYAAYAPGDTYVSMLCHGAIYLCGLVAIRTERYSAAEARELAMGVCLVAVWAALFRPLEAGRERLLIYILLDGECIKRALAPRLWRYALPAYDGALAALVAVSIRGFFRKNRAQPFSAPAVC